MCLQGWDFIYVHKQSVGVSSWGVSSVGVSFMESLHHLRDSMPAVTTRGEIVDYLDQWSGPAWWIPIITYYVIDLELLQGPALNGNVPPYPTVEGCFHSVLQPAVCPWTSHQRQHIIFFSFLLFLFLTLLASFTGLHAHFFPFPYHPWVKKQKKTQSQFENLGTNHCF